MKQHSSRKKKISLVTFIIVLLIAVAGIALYLSVKNKPEERVSFDKKEVDKIIEKDSSEWKAPDESAIPGGIEGDEIKYGKELIVHTSVYFGPKGKVAQLSNGMNCENCHADAGRSLYGNNFSAVAANFPQFRNRSESWVSIAGRIASCFKRSLNGKSPDTSGKEINAMIAYIKWIGKDVPKGEKPKAAGVVHLKYLDREADPAKGRIIYASTCQLCHGKNGQGELNEEGTEYIFPPLWGSHSYNDGAGLYRIGNFAGFVKGNMPFGTIYKYPVLSDEEAWDVAAFVNSQPRPHKNQSGDYRIISHKPVDFPFGPYADTFTEKEHKYGPFPPIIAEKNSSVRQKK